MNVPVRHVRAYVFTDPVTNLSCTHRLTALELARVKRRRDHGHGLMGGVVVVVVVLVYVFLSLCEGFA
mgnify:CR=1 FL=1